MKWGAGIFSLFAVAGSPASEVECLFPLSSASEATWRQRQDVGSRLVLNSTAGRGQVFLPNLDYELQSPASMESLSRLQSMMFTGVVIRDYRNRVLREGISERPEPKVDECEP